MRKKPLARNAEVYTAMRSRFSGIDIVPEVVRLCAMNLYLHDIAGRESPVEARDALLGAGGQTFDVILTNPPFGQKQSYRIVRDDGEIDTEREDYDRQDFFVTTSNKQGVKANVLFFDKKPVSAEANSKELWIYDLRTNQRFTLKERPMTRVDLDDFVACYKSGRRRERVETDRFHRFAHAELITRDKINLDIFWLKDDTLDDPDLLPPPDEIAAEIVENLEAALDRFRKVALTLQS
jgi:type I restriction enzyme M protein